MDYFNYEVLYVMNVTDIDDKIIRRARQEHLFIEYSKESRELVSAIADVSAAIKVCVCGGGGVHHICCDSWHLVGIQRENRDRS